MNTTIIADENIDDIQGKPGAQLAIERVKKGYSAEYVAGKLHLRVRIIELLEADDYHLMPEAVFIKGYLRAYAKLVDLAPEPLLDLFNARHITERKSERTLWQSRRETNRAEHAIRWLTGFFAVAVLAAVVIWWHANQDNERLFPKNVSHVDTSSGVTESEIRLTDLSKMRSLLSSRPQQSDILEKTLDEPKNAPSSLESSSDALKSSLDASNAPTNVSDESENPSETSENVAAASEKEGD